MRRRICEAVGRSRSDHTSPWLNPRRPGIQHRRLLCETLEDRCLLSLTSLDWSAYVGGSDLDSGFAIAYDPSGNAIIASRTRSAGWVSGGYDTSHGGNFDGYVAKYSPTGVHLWSTYLGGAGYDEVGAVVVDSQGYIYVGGGTQSAGWVSGGFDTTMDGACDAFVAKLSPTGEHVWSTYLGGNETTPEEQTQGICLDSSGNVVVSGLTFAGSWVSGGFDTTYGGGCDGFVAKLDSAGQHVWSTFVGGASRDDAQDIACDGSDNLLVAGRSGSAGWASGGYDTSHGGSYDAFLVKMDPTGGHVWSTYLGDTALDDGREVAVDASGNALVAGHTSSSGWVSGGFDTTYGGGEDGFLAKVSPAGGHVWSTYVGNLGYDRAYGVAVDSSGAALVTGLTESSGWTWGGSDTTYNGNQDGFVAEISPTGQHVWSTYLGGSGSDSGYPIAVNPLGDVVFVGGATSSVDFPGANNTYHGGTRDAFIAKINDLSNREVLFTDDFENNSIDGTLWIYGGSKRGYDQLPSGDWSYSHTETDYPSGPGDDGSLSVNVIGPATGNTYGAEAWLRTTYNYNDGNPHIVNFTWDAWTAENHGNGYFVQITDGYVPATGPFNWPYFEPRPAELEPTVDLLWTQEAVSEDWYRGGWLWEDSPNQDVPQGTPETHSIVIAPSGTATLYDGPDGTGNLVRQEALDPSDVWYIRLMVWDATSSGFGAGEAELRLRFFESLTSNVDYGDAPDPAYPTLFAGDGTRHIVDPALYLGGSVDKEFDGQPNAAATGDDLNGDDDDGIVINGQLVSGGATGLTVTASQAGFLDAWIDLDQDGTFDHPGEQFFASQPLFAGPNPLNVAIPGTTPAGNTFARFRFSSTGGLAPAGLAFDGEVEDYMVTIEPGSVLGDLVWHDLDGNGIQDAGEPGIKGAVAEVFSSADATTLYDGSLGTLMTAQGWVYSAVPPGTIPSLGVQGTVLDTTADSNISAGFTCPVMPVLDRIDGFTATFDVQVTAESHGSNDRAGFSVILLSSDLRGIELGFWANEIWAQTDTPLFTHGEGVAFDTTSMTTYDLEIFEDTYTLSAGGIPILTGSVRDYSSHPSPVYSTPNLLFLGDDTTSANGSFEIAYVAVKNARDVSRGVAITDENGLWSLGGLMDGINYYVEFRTPAGDPAYAFTTQDAGGDDTLDSDANAVGRTAMFTMGADDLTLDAGLINGPAPGFGFALTTGGDSDHDSPQDVAIDADGNIYVTGKLSPSTADFDPGPGTYNLSSAGNEDIFVAKYTSTGALVWARQMGGPDTDIGYGIAVASDRSVYVTGTFNTTADFDPGPETYNITSFRNISGYSDIFVAKLDALGNFVWARQMGGLGGDGSFDIAITSDDCVYTTGRFRDMGDFDPGVGTYTLTSAGDDDIFLSKLDANGGFLDARQIGGAGTSDCAHSVTTDSDGNVLLTGDFQGMVDFDPGPGTYNLTSTGNFDIFVAKYSSTGTLTWARQMAGTEQGAGRGIVTDAVGSVYTTGHFRGTVDFDPGVDPYDLTSAGENDAFISKLDAAGNFVWARQFGGGSHDLSKAIDLSDDGCIYTTGYFTNTVDFDPGVGTYDFTSAGDEDIFVSKLDPAGNFVWARQMGGGSLESGWGIAVASDESVYTVGYFQSTADFDPGSGTFSLTTTTGSPVGNSDIYVSRLFPVNRPSDINLPSTSVNENQPVGTAVGTFSSTDPDSGNTFTYTLVAGAGDTGNGSFAIVGDQLQTAEVFDFETQSSYSIRVRTTDSGGLWYEEAFTIDVTGLNETPTDLALFSSSVNENEPVGTAVGTLSSSDPDAGETFTYTLVAGPGDTGNGSFAIVGDQLQTGAVFDFEAQSSYSIRVRTTDSGGLWREEVFTIDVGNVEEGEIHGTKWNDADGDGEWDAGETGLAGVTIYLDLDDDGVLDAGEPSTLTDADGNYSFTSLVPGVYDVAEVPQTGWELTFPTSDWAPAGIGDTELAAELGASVPTGSGITASQVEGLSGGHYTPDTARAEFAGKTFTFVSGNTGGSSSHATTVGRCFYSNTSSIASGVADIDNWEANDWIGAGFLQTGSTLEPAVETRDVQNHSWIGSLGSNPLDTDALRRFDYAINRDDYVAVVGLNNGTGAVPRLLPHSYNAISVGRTDGNHSYGLTTLDVAGRVKPEIVVPSSATSWATPIVGSAAAVLLETANDTPALGNAAHSEVIKALLLAGATKDEFPDWDRTATRPLDDIYGAGELNVYNSHHTLVAGEQEAGGSSLVGRTGWDFEESPASNDLLYFFDAPSSRDIDAMSILLTWNREITDGLGGTDWGDPQASVADLDLELWTATGFTIDTRLDYSASTVDNVEHIWAQNLTGSRYAIRVLGAAATDFALAWRSVETGVRPVVVAPGEIVQDINFGNHNSPPTDIGLSSASVDENQPAGAVVGTLSSTDPDAGETFTYSLVAGAGDSGNASFVIAGDQLQAAATFDFEAQSSYSIRVRTTDLGGLWCEEVFTIDVSNRNDMPTDIALSQSSVDENQPVGTTVGILSSIDPDAGETFTYTLVAGAGDTDNGLFAIVGDQLQTNAVLDFETQSSYSIRVRTTDSGGLWYEEVFTIDVVDSPLGEIHGTKWNDLDCDGFRDIGEPGLEGWTIYVDLDNDGEMDAGEPSTVTDINGDYSFTGLTAGTYTVAEADRPDWARTFPASIERVSVASDGAESNGGSSGPSISADGRYVAFQSSASNLVPGDTNGAQDVFVYDRRANTIEAVTAGSSGSGASTIVDPGPFAGSLSSELGEIAGTGLWVVEGLKGGWHGTTMSWNVSRNPDSSWHYSYTLDVYAGAVSHLIIETAGDFDPSEIFNASHPFQFGLFGPGPGNPNMPGDMVGLKFEPVWGTTLTVSFDCWREPVWGDFYAKNGITGGTDNTAWNGNTPGILGFAEPDADPDPILFPAADGSVDCHILVPDCREGSAAGRDPAISADGRYVAFCSFASDLVSGDTNGRGDIFVFDRLTDTTERVSLAWNGLDGNGDSYLPSISADGRYVAFQSRASNLVPGDTNGVWDVFVYDRQADAMERVSLASDGSEGNGDSWVPSLSSDGRYVAFQSRASNLVPDDANGVWDVFVYDRQAGAVERISPASDGSEGNDDSRTPSISSDGRHVAFQSRASNLVSDDTNGAWDIFVHDRQADTMERASLASDGAEGNHDSFAPSISADGRYVAFYSYAANLVPDDANGRSDVFVYDRQTDAVERVSLARHGSEADNWNGAPVIGADGLCAAFPSAGSNLVPGDKNGRTDVFVAATAASLPGTHSVVVIADATVEDIDFGNVAPPESQVVDDGDAGFSTSGDWYPYSGLGFEDNLHYSFVGDGSDVASWTFTVIPGLYQVAVTWSTHPNRATNAPYTVYDGATSRGTVQVNQRVAPDDFSNQGADWETLGVFTITGNTLRVELSDAANGLLIADAVRIEKVATQIIDNGDTNFGTTGDWYPYSGLGFENDLHYSFVGDGSDVASWTFTVTPGQYQVAATWAEYPNRATNAPYEVFNGATSLETVPVNQQAAPDDFSDQGAAWETLGTYTITGDTLRVELSDAANGLLIADAVRIEKVATQIIDNGDTNFGTSGDWYPYSSLGFENDLHYSFVGDGSDVASWTFAVTTGQYEVAATWSEHANRATNAPYEVFNGATSLETVPVDQQAAPDDFTDQGTTWETLGTYTITGDTLVVKLSDAANGLLIADAVRIEQVGSPLLAAGGEVSPAGELAALTGADLQPIVTDAIADWAGAGLAADQLEALLAVDFIITDLPGAMLGLATLDAIYLDVNAAGHGWFIDPTPGVNEEFQLTGSELRAVDPRAVDRMDLLTVVSHELGHTLGLEDLSASSGSLMSGTLETGLRREPDVAEIDALFAQF